MSHEHPDVLLGITFHRPEEKRILSALEVRGLSVQVLLDSNGLGQVNAKQPLCRVAVIRSMSHQTAENRSSILELSGVHTVNSGKAIRICANKALQALHLKKYGVPQPEFNIAYKISDVGEMGAELGWNYIVKPVGASWGRGIAKIVNQACFESWAAGRESVDPSEKAFPILVQKYVEKGNFDIRVVVVDEKPVVAFKRVSEHWKTNTHLGAKVEPISITQGIRDIVAQVIEAIGPGIYGLDLFEDQSSGRLLVCEVNQNPEFDKSSKIHGVDVADHIGEYIEHILDGTKKD